MSRPSTRRTIDLHPDIDDMVKEMQNRFLSRSWGETVERCIKIAYEVTKPGMEIHLKKGDGVVREVMFK
jgi:hypothetical protein